MKRKINSCKLSILKAGQEVHFGVDIEHKKVNINKIIQQD